METALNSQNMPLTPEQVQVRKALSLSLSAFSDQHRRTSLILSIYFFFPFFLGWVLMFY
jgi:hypothetical protein